MWRSSRAAIAVLALVAGCATEIVEPTLPPAWTPDRAQDPLSRDQCIQLAAGSAPNAAAWQARMSAASANLDQARLLANPTLSLSWEDFGLNGAAAYNPVQTTLALAMSLQDVFSREHRAQAAQYAFDAEKADLCSEYGELAAQVSRAYDELVTARARVALERELSAATEQQCADIEKFVASGLSPHFDLERAGADREQSRARVARAESDARSLELEFDFALGFDRPVSLRLSDTLSDSPQSTSRDLESLLTLAANQRPELSATKARYQEELERLRLAADRVQFLPTIGAGPRRQGDELRGVATIDVALPIFDSGATAQRGEQAALVAAAARLRATAQQIARDVCSALERLTSAESYLNEHAHELEVRRRALRERTERLFRAGEIQYTDLALARRDEVEARIGLLEAELAVAHAHVDLDRAIGAFPPPPMAP